MTAEVTRDEFEDYRRAHHDAMNTLAKTSEAMNIKVDRIYDMLAGTFERPGLVHRLASVEARQEAHEKVSPEEQRSLWWRERATKVVDAVIVLLVVSILVLAAKAFILDTVKDLSITQSTGADGQITIVKKAPKPPECPDCGIATVQAEQE